MNEILNYDESNTKQTKRKDIIRTSMKIFIREGIHTVTMADLAKESNISLRSLYYYYSTKQDLAVDIQIICMDQYTYFRDLEVNELKTAYELLEEYFSIILTFINENQSVVKYITAFDYYFHNEYPNEKYSQFLTKIYNSSYMLGLMKKSTDNSVELFGEDYELVLTSVIQAFLAYSQKIIYREKAMMSENKNLRGNLELYSKIMLSSLKKR